MAARRTGASRSRSCRSRRTICDRISPVGGFAQSDGSFGRGFRQRAVVPGRAQRVAHILDAAMLAQKPEVGIGRARMLPRITQLTPQDRRDGTWGKRMIAT